LKVHFHKKLSCLVALLLTLPLPLQADLLQSSTITAINTELNNTTWAASNLRDDSPSTRWLSYSANSTSDVNFQFNASGDAFCYDEVNLINYGNDDRSVQHFMLLASNNTAISGDTSTNATGWKPVVADESPSGLLDYLSWAQGARLATTNSQLNATTFAANNINDGNVFSRWLSKSKQSHNILEYTFDTDWDGNTGNGIPVEEIEITNYGNDDRSIKELQIEVTTDGTNWFKLEVPGTQAGDLEYVYTQSHEGGVLGAVDSQLNNTTWAAAHIHDGSQLTRWLSRNTQGNNTIEFTFDTNNNSLTGANADTDDLFNIDKIHIENYGNDDRSIREFQVAVKTSTNGSWTKITVPGAVIGAENYDFLSSHHGAELIAFGSQLNNTTWGADNLHDGDHMTRWLSRNTQSHNTFEFQFDVNEDGTKDNSDHFTIKSFYLQNYGNDDRSIREFQVSVKTATNPSWQKIKVPGALIGAADYNFLLADHGAVLEAFDSQLNTSTWAAKNIHDGSQITRWLSKNLQSRNKFEFTFDVNEDGNTGTADDLFTMESFYLENYGADDRSIRQFQVLVKTQSEPTWQKIEAPNAIIGLSDHNFLLADHGGILTAVDSQYNATSWAASNIHDGSHMTRWLSPNTQLRNTFDFQFDVNEDGNASTADDLFTMEKFYLQNYGNDDRSIREFQIAVKTQSDPTWKKITVPGSTAGLTDHNFLLADHGAILTSVTSQLNTTSWAAEHIHDGNQITRWLSSNTRFLNTLDFQFDVDEDGATGTATDLFTMENFYLQNYGNDDRSIREFQIEVKTASNTNWTKIQVPGTAANDAGYNFSLASHGGELTFITSELNTSSWAASNIHDGNHITRWLSRNTQFLNTLAFAFDTNNDGNTGDAINLDTIELINYGNDDRSIQTFEVDIQISGGPWQTINAPAGGTIFTANMDNNGQSWSVTPQVNVTATRIRTLSNYGDPNYIGASEITFSGASVGPSHTFVAAMNGNGETFSLVTPIVDVTDVRLRTISNYGDPNYIGAAEFKVQGPSIIPSSTFVAAMHDNGETFILDTPIVDVTDVQLITISNHGDPNYVGAREFKVLGAPTVQSKTFVAALHGNGETFTLSTPITDVTDVQLLTISNYGDPNYVGAKEFKVLGPSITKTATFVGAMHDNGETFVLDNEDIPVDVTDVKLTTISNHGDPNYVGARDFQILGDSVTETKTFTAAMHGNGESFVLDSDDIPINVTHVKLITINNHGDPNYVGAAEFEVIGRSITPAHTFVLPMQAEPYRIVLDNEDTVEDIIGARIVTIRNHGDPNYIGVADFKLLGTAIGPSYVFEASMDSSTQSFDFLPTNSSLVRFHTLSNHGDRNYTGAAELVINSGFCPTGQWKLDEANWAGDTGEVIDTSGGDHNGTVFGIGSGDADPNTSRDNPAIIGNPGTCGYGEFDGVDDYIEISDSDDLDNTNQLTLSAWFNAESFHQDNGTNARGLFSKRPTFADNVSYGAFFWNNHGNNLYIDIDGTNNRFASNTSFKTNTWYHVAIVYDGTLPTAQRVSLYVNGVLDGVFPESSSSIPDTESNFYIGNLYTGLDELKVFDGAIDEVNVIPRALSATDVVKLKETTQPCAVTPLFLDISTESPLASTCKAQPIIIRACLDANCDDLYPNYSGTVNITTLNNHGNWSINDANGTLIDTAGDDNGAATYTFDGSLDDSSVTLDFNNTHAEAITITASDFDAPADTTSDTITFSDNVFVFDHTDNLHVAGRPQKMNVSLYTKGEGTCGINTLYDGDKNIKLSLTRDIADPAGTAPTINNGNPLIETLTPFELTFDKGTAKFELDTSDVGKYNLNIIDDTLLFSDQNINGTSNSIVTRPFGFYINVYVDGDEDGKGESPEDIINPKAADHSENKFIPAGDNFTIRVKAVAWQSADDSNGDGIPDGHNDFDYSDNLNNNNFNPANGVNLSDNIVLSNFQNTSVTISAYEFLPFPSTLNNVLRQDNSQCINCTISNFIDEKDVSSNFSYNEVGIIEIKAELTTYLGKDNISINGASGYVGRFIPHHFAVTKEKDNDPEAGNGAFENACLLGTVPFTYTGQSFTYDPLSLPFFYITAENAHGDITENYTGNFQKLIASDIERTFPETDDVDNAGNTVTVNVSVLPDIAGVIGKEGQLAGDNGEFTYTFSTEDSFTYTKNDASQIAPFNSNYEIEITSIQDTDEVRANKTSDNNVTTITPAPVNLRHGRLMIENNFGPETSDLPLTLITQHWNGTQYVTNTDDNCTQINSDSLNVTNPNFANGASTTVKNSAVAHTSEGEAQHIMLTAPGVTNVGTAEVNYNLAADGANTPWLQHEWVQNTGQSNPTATVTFGLFRGNDRIISWREIMRN